jgi:hypothetical protein
LDSAHFIFGSMNLVIIDQWPNNSPEPPPITVSVPPSRLTDWAARLSFLSLGIFRTTYEILIHSIVASRYHFGWLR